MTKTHESVTENDDLENKLDILFGKREALKNFPYKKHIQKPVFFMKFITNITNITKSISSCIFFLFLIIFFF
jgi:hypothetical protein